MTSRKTLYVKKGLRVREIVRLKANPKRFSIVFVSDSVQMVELEKIDHVQFSGVDIVFSTCYHLLLRLNAQANLAAY